MGLFLGSLSRPSPMGPPHESISNNESACVDHCWVLCQALYNLRFTAPRAFCSSDVQCPGRSTAGAFRLWSRVEGRLVLGGSSGVLSCHPHGSLISWLQKPCWLTPLQTSAQANPLRQGPRVPMSASCSHRKMLMLSGAECCHERGLRAFGSVRGSLLLPLTPRPESFRGPGLGAKHPEQGQWRVHPVWIVDMHIAPDKNVYSETLLVLQFFLHKQM